MPFFVEGCRILILNFNVGGIHEKGIETAEYEECLVMWFTGIAKMESIDSFSEITTDKSMTSSKDSEIHWK